MSNRIPWHYRLRVSIKRARLHWRNIRRIDREVRDELRRMVKEA